MVKTKSCVVAGRCLENPLLHKPLELKSLKKLPFPGYLQEEAGRGVFLLFLQPAGSIALGGAPPFSASLD